MKALMSFFRAHEEPDEVWFNQALDLGATIFISPDIDISLMVDKMDSPLYKLIEVPQRLSGIELMRFLRKRLKLLKKEQS